MFKLSRRGFALASLAAVLSPSTAMSALLPNGDGDHSSLLRGALAIAAARGEGLALGAGSFKCANLSLPSGTAITGVPGRTFLEAIGSAPIFIIEDATAISLHGLTFSSTLRAGNLVKALRVKGLAVDACRFYGAARGLELEACAGRIANCDFSQQEQGALFSIDATGLRVTDNTVSDMANNGIQVWRSLAGEDGTIITGNRIERIAARDGGTGQNGNGISVFRAGNVVVANNRVTDCAFSAIRCNSGSGIQIIGNSVARCEEVALYAEFDFRGALISGNIVEDSAFGISIANYDVDGRLAVCNGNVIRNLRQGTGDPTAQVGGIHCEADTMVSNNVIENARDFGIRLGWGKCRNLTATANLVRGTRHGIEVSAAEGATSIMVANNVITAETAIIAMDHQNPASGDLLNSASEIPAHVFLSGNRVGT